MWEIDKHNLQNIFFFFFGIQGEFILILFIVCFAFLQQYVLKQMPDQ